MNVQKIRQDFPVLQQEIKGKPLIYFDSACMTLRPRQVIDAIKEYYEKYPACGERGHHKLAKKVTEEYHRARETVAKFIGAKTEEIIFTKNTTEGINLVANSFGFSKGNVVIGTDKEHNSNLLPWQRLSGKIGVRREVLQSNPDNTFSIENFKEVMEKNKGSVKLVSIVHTSNMDGVTNPAKEIIKISHDYDVPVLLDAAQSVPHKSVNVKKLDADFLAFSGHKMMGPSGTGVLYAKKNLLEKMEPFIVGGGTVVNTTYDTAVYEKPPEKFEAGLQNYSGAMGLAAAVNYLRGIGVDDIERHEITLNRVLTNALGGIPGIRIIGPAEPELRGGIVSFTAEKMEPHNIAIMLDSISNIAVRSGQHCVHSWFNEHRISGSVRASFYLYNTVDEVNAFIEAIQRILKLR